jgi:hypothetical protein
MRFSPDDYWKDCLLCRIDKTKHHHRSFQRNAHIVKTTWLLMTDFVFPATEGLEN